MEADKVTFFQPCAVFASERLPEPAFNGGFAGIIRLFWQILFETPFRLPALW